ncbi:MAG: (2Fe-2S)-binding protein [Hyphomonadaceae bacterium]|nr:(2Fe-2S)-binding protein [Hyphomonadaceae bacterium]
MISLTINGASHALDVEEDMPLLWALRDVLNLTGSKYGCGVGACGACTVLINGQAVRSCSMPVGAVGGGRIETIESLKQGDTLSKVQQAWVETQAPQCGYCQSGQIMAATALLRAKPRPTDADIDAAMTNICRCGAYEQIRAAIHRAAEA